MTSLTPVSPPPAAVGQSRSQPAAVSLSHQQKAAVVVQFLLQEGADLSLAGLPEALQAQLAQQIGAMQLVDRTTLGQVLGEFVQELEQIGVTFPHDLTGALQVLDGRLDPRTAALLRKEAGMRQYRDPWDRVADLEADALVPIFEVESTEIAAVILSKLDVSQAAEVLGLLPGPLARQITLAVSQTQNVTPEAVDRIGLSLASQLDARPERAFDLPPEKRIGEILNFSKSATRDELLSGLGQDDADFAAKVREKIFTFKDIPVRVAPLDVPKIVKSADPEQLQNALAAALQGNHADVAEFILSNTSPRMANSIREEIAESPALSPPECEAALSELTKIVRELEAGGDLQFVTLSEG